MLLFLCLLPFPLFSWKLHGKLILSHQLLYDQAHKHTHPHTTHYCGLLRLISIHLSFCSSHFVSPHKIIDLISRAREGFCTTPALFFDYCFLIRDRTIVGTFNDQNLLFMDGFSIRYLVCFSNVIHIPLLGLVGFIKFFSRLCCLLLTD